MVRGFWRKFDRDWGWNLARLLGYACIQMIFAVAGLQLIVLALVLRLLAPGSEQAFEGQMLRFLPDHITVTATSSFEHSLRTTPGWILLIGVPITLWYGTRFFVVAESVLCVIFRRRQRPLLRQNRAALAMLLLVAVLMPIIVLSTTIVPHFGLPAATSTTTTTGAIHRAHYGDDPRIALLSFGTSLAANFILLLVAYMRLTPGRVSFRSAWPGALAGACLAQLYLLIFPLYAHTILHPDHFGSIAGFGLVLIVFFFAYALFVVVGAELAAWREGYREAPRDIVSMLADAASIPSTPTAPLAKPLERSHIERMDVVSSRFGSR
ncbi:MAG: hypothetical protein OJF49_004315 [Ktedonobacterales bacterium]|jgi:uncharacterized BrkB/YihY/UPF0761 family membrane protein|nr:MAG: hypothetical protein OJF49_004315 [Ktedonobacterales bacterium]